LHLLRSYCSIRSLTSGDIGRFTTQPAGLLVSIPVVCPSLTAVSESRVELRLPGGSNEWTRERLSIDVPRWFESDDVFEPLMDLSIRRGIPEHLRSDSGSEFTARAVCEWLDRLGVRTLYIEHGCPWENGYIESFNGKPRSCSQGEHLQAKPGRKGAHPVFVITSTAERRGL